MRRTFRLTEGKLVETSAENAQLTIYINPDEQERFALLNPEAIDEHNLNSSLDPEELGRLEFESNHLFTIIKRPKRYSSQDNFLFKITSIGLFLYDAEKLIMVAEEDLPWGSRIFSKMQSIHDVYLRIIFMCIVHFEEHLKVIRKVSDELEMEINRAMSNKDLLHMFKLEKSLVYYLDAINSNTKVVEKLKISSTKIGFSQKNNDFLEDLIIEGAQCYQQADSYSQVLSSLMDARASIINNNLNIRIKTLTIMSICIMTPTFVVSVFSMNVPIPQVYPLVTFWGVLAMAFASVVGVLLLWFYRKW